ncbi:5925_t:CDS:2 [Cetraspora pellucida]|uniref:5925_t:CDS:1 n=1 Tax=Cetraspora pellucida TaxID=1433469 RepID=A0ACA9MIV3_9GLOM|nr:5925_t:CDS:2 [Cetraspora pellucida]
MIWECFAGEEKGPLVFMKERNDKVLKENLIPFRYELIANFGNDITFQDDNASIHTARYTREWMEAENIQRLPWPAQSPDLNPIENMALLEEWENLDSSIFMNLINSMPNHIVQVIENRGYSCKY